MAETSREDQHSRRVLIIVENVSAPADQRLWSEATALRRAHYDVTVICPKRRSNEIPEETIDGVQVFRHPLPFRTPAFLAKLIEYPIALFWEFVLSIKIARRYGFDVIHVCNPPNMIFLIAVIYKIIGRKSIVFDYRDATAGRHEEKLAARGSFIERIALKRADIVLAINGSHRDIAIRRGGVPAEKVIVVRPCPDLERVKRKHPDPLWRNGRTYMVSYAGQINVTEGVDLFISAIEHIVHGQRRADIQFVIAGGGPDWHEIASLCGKIDLSDYVTFAGLVDDETLFSILSTADVCVDPRRVTVDNSISISQKLMEYMAIGKPIVQFDMAEGRLLAQEASRYARENDPIDFGNQILELLDSAEIRNIMSDFAQQRIRKELSWHREQRKLLSAYDAIFISREQRLERSQQKKKPKIEKRSPAKKK